MFRSDRQYEKIQARLQQVEKERDAAVRDIESVLKNEYVGRDICALCKQGNTKGNVCKRFFDSCKEVAKWRGVQKDE